MYVSENIPSVGIPKINLTTSIIQAPGKHIYKCFFHATVAGVRDKVDRNSWQICFPGSG